MTTTVDLNGSEESLYAQCDDLRKRTARAPRQAAVQHALIDRMESIADELERRRDERNEARARAAACTPRELPPPLPKRPKVSMMAGPGASKYLTT
jgi:hypothetical protein